MTRVTGMIGMTWVIIPTGITGMTRTTGITGMTWMTDDWDAKGVWND